MTQVLRTSSSRALVDKFRNFKFHQRLATTAVWIECLLPSYAFLPSFLRNSL
ncbi:hypothetical protein X975_17947, partial [Stegodyphus mimosarum]